MYIRNVTFTTPDRIRATVEVPARLFSGRKQLYRRYPIEYIGHNCTLWIWGGKLEFGLAYLQPGLDVASFLTACFVGTKYKFILGPEKQAGR